MFCVRTVCVSDNPSVKQTQCVCLIVELMCLLYLYSCVCVVCKCLMCCVIVWGNAWGGM